METWETTLLAELERLGEEEVRKQQLQTRFGSVGSQKHAFVQEWLRSKSDARRESREDMSLSISRRALRISWIATSIAAIAMIIAASDKVIVFLRWVGVLKP